MKKFKVIALTSCFLVAIVTLFAFNARRATLAYFNKGAGCVQAISDISITPQSNHIASTDQSLGFATLNGFTLYKNSTCSAGQEFYAK